MSPFSIIPATPGTVVAVRLPDGTVDTTPIAVIAWMIAPIDDDLPDAEVYPVGVEGVIQNWARVRVGGASK